MLQQQNMQHIRVTSKIAPSQVQPVQTQYQAQHPGPSQIQQQNNMIRQQQPQFQQQQQQPQMQQQQQQIRPQQPQTQQMLPQQQSQMLPQQQRIQPNAPVSGQMMVSQGQQVQPQQSAMYGQGGPYNSAASQAMSMGQFINTQTSMGAGHPQPVRSIVPTQPQSIRSQLGTIQHGQEQPQRSQQFPRTSQPQQMAQTSQYNQVQPQQQYSGFSQTSQQMGHQQIEAQHSQPISGTDLFHAQSQQHRRTESSNKQQSQPQYFQHPQFPHHSQNQQLLPQSAKKMTTLPQDYWVESDLSPIQDVSPTIEAAEQRSMEIMKRNSSHGHDVSFDFIFCF